MELFRNIRLKIGNSVLEKKVSGTSRKVSYTSIDKIKKIGIVWDASKPGEFPCLSKFHQKMNERNIEVFILGYYPGKELPDQYTAIRYLSCLRKDELGMFYIPASQECESFIKNKFDVLIDVNFQKVFPLYYISSLSAAFFKVGLANGESTSTPFDLMIEMKDKVDIDYYLTQVLYYLEMIDSKTNKQAEFKV